MKISIPLNVIKAASYCVANNKDIRHYLRHVCFDFKHGEVNHLRLISTDGAILSAFQVDLVYEDDSQSADFQLIVPIDVIKNAIKTKRNNIVFESLPDGRYMLADNVFSPVDGKYPDYMRVIPSITDKPADKPLQFDPDLLVKGKDALNAFRNYSNPVNFRLDHLPTLGSVMHDGASDAVIVVMPLRDSAFAHMNSDNYQGFFSI